MPYFDGTGPLGNGAMGRGLGPCGRGLNRGRGGFSRRFWHRNWTKQDELKSLDEEEKTLKEELAAISQERENLTNQK
ncbi:MAG: DUF5320 family protein [Patescibacteria group bacterium]|jgi:hypothetical protein|nr:DUF5320 family protein [Patescibacteria group bacterium]